MIKSFLIKTFNADKWANDLIVESIKSTSTVPDRVIFLFAHIQNAQLMWLNRVQGVDLTCTLFQERTLEDCTATSNSNHLGWTNLLHSYTDSDFERVITFKHPLDGLMKELSVLDAIYHINNHSAYHRGQMVQLLKGQVETLPLTTYITFAAKEVN
jgi:uncharacterized damage-inducible protein DinB